MSVSQVGCDVPSVSTVAIVFKISLGFSLAYHLICENDLLAADWKQLRSESMSWQEENQSLSGFDGSTRFWCSAAIFDVNWVAQRVLKEDQFECYLTEDLALIGFKEKLPFTVSYEWKVKLAEKLQWRHVVNQVLSKKSVSQLGLFED
ncbi:MAG: hypothetical protein ACJAVI_003401 [Candidatus Azotimanducaceae bacterium]|jgi:hypothetical protein